MESLTGRLTTQRLLLMGLLVVMAASAFLLWMLRSATERGRGAPRTAGREENDGALLDDTAPLAPPGRTTGVALDESARDGEVARVSRAPGARTPEGAEDSFDPGAILGWVRSRGTPVAEVELHVYGATDAFAQPANRGPPLAEIRSDDQGYFRLGGLTPHTRFTLHAQHPGFLPSEAVLHSGHAEEIELEPTATVAGTVVASETGRPLEGVEVALERWNMRAGILSDRVSATSDAEGRWRLPWARPGIERFLVLRAGFLPERHEFQVSPQGGDGYEIRVGSRAALELELYELESGALLVSTEILVDGIRVRTDERAHVRLPLVESVTGSSTVRVSLALEGGCLTLGRIDPSTVNGILRLPLARGGTVEGHVLDGQGAGIGEARMRVSGGGRPPPGLGLPEGFLLYPAPGGARSDPDGHFALTGIAPRDRLVEVLAEHPEHPLGRSEGFEFSQLGARVQVDVILESGASVAGLTRVDGEPASLRIFWNGARRSGWTRSDDRGAYRLVGLPSGELSLRARLEHEQEDLLRAEDLLLTLADEDDQTADFDLVSGRARILGRVVDVHGVPVSGAQVVASASEEGEWLEEEPQAASRADGRFELFVPEGAAHFFDLSAESGARRARAERVRAGAEVELVLPALSTVSLRVIDALERHPVLGFQFFWRTSEEGAFERYTLDGKRLSPGPSGGFLAELPCGRVDLAVSARQHGFVSERRDEVELLEGRTTVLEFRLERGYELDIEVHAEAEAGDAMRMLRRGRFLVASEEQLADRARGGDFFQEDVANAQSLRPDEDGVAHLRGMASGSYRFVNAPRGLVFNPRTFAMPAVAQHRQSVTIEPMPQEKPSGAPR